MSESVKSVTRARRVLVVTNPGSDSECEEDEPQIKYNHWPNPLSQQRPTGTSLYPAKMPYPSALSPPILSPERIGSYPGSWSNPALPSPSSSDSRATDASQTTPPPVTPSPSFDLIDDSPKESSFAIGTNDRDSSPQLPLATTLPASYSRPANLLQARQLVNSPPRMVPSPTSSINDSYPSSVAPTPISSSDKLLIVVTADSERYLTVDITGAKNSAFIRERIFNKFCIWEEEHQSNFSIYQTEIGAFAIGEALTGDRLFELCRERGDSKGSLKFLVSHSSAVVHEHLPASHSVSPIVTTIPPPVLPAPAPAHVYDSYGPLKPKRRSGSRPASLSSASEQPLGPDPSAGYEASVSDDLDREDRDKSVTRLPLPSKFANVPHSPLNNRRPNGTGPRSVSPIGAPIRPSSPPPSVEHNRPQTNDAARHGPLPPPPLSPSRPNFTVPEDNTLTPPTRVPHHRVGSDPATDRDQTMRVSENRVEYPQDQWKRQFQGRMKVERPRDGPVGNEVLQREKRNQIDVDDPLVDGANARGDTWVTAPRDNVSRASRGQQSSPQDGQRPSPSHRKRLNPSGGYKVPFHVRGLVIPNPPRAPPPVPPVSTNDARNSPPRQAGQPVPSNWAVTWKGEPKGSQRPVPASLPLTRLTKPIDKSKSMDNLRASAMANHPAVLQPGMRRAALPMSRTNGGSVGIGLYPPSVDAARGLPKSYETQRTLIRPPPSQSLDLTSSHSGFVSPNRELLPRPSSALGDTSPSSQRPTRDLRSPTRDGESCRSPRALSPANFFNQAAQFFGSRLHSNPEPLLNADQPNEMKMPHTPPKSPASPRDLPDARDRLSNQTDLSSSSTLGKNNQHTTFSVGVSSASADSTLRQEDHSWIARMLDGDGPVDGTLVAKAKAAFRPEKADSATEPTSLWSASARRPSKRRSLVREDSDSDDVGTSIWQVEPTTMPVVMPRGQTRGPPLKVKIELDSNSTSAQTLVNPVSSSSVTVSPSSANRPLDTVPVSAVSRDGESGPGIRASTFKGMTWAPRPPPEDVYDRLEEFFPGHDLDKPVIEAFTGGISPTAADYTLVAPTPANDKSRVKGKKSIRIVAEEHKKRIDRTSRADASFTSVLRKRSTKLWGSRLEEVTTAQPKPGLNPSLPDSPSGGPKPIFKWVRGELIGKGTYGRVYLALNATTGEMIAVKQVEIPTTASDKNDSRQVTVVQALKMESETLKNLDHPNIVQYLGFEETPNFLSIFLEYVPGGSIGSCLLKHGAFDEDVTKSFMGQILSGLEYLHSKGILHRDLKADNILVETSGVCKISDFGIAKRTDDDSDAHTAMQGTVFWMAPEVINTQKKGYNFKIDIWSIGCIMLEMWAGSRPWLGHELMAVMFKLYEAKLPPPIPNGLVLSPLADDFRLKCFAINPDERPTAAELRRHPYLELPHGWVFTGFK